MRLNENIITNSAIEVVNTNSVTPLRQAPVFISSYRPQHVDAKDIITFAVIKMKHYYDLHH